MLGTAVSVVIVASEGKIQDSEITTTFNPGIANSQCPNMICRVKLRDDARCGAFSRYFQGTLKAHSRRVQRQPAATGLLDGAADASSIRQQFFHRALALPGTVCVAVVRIAMRRHSPVQSPTCRRADGTRIVFWRD
jgi:hypothetical protein